MTATLRFAGGVTLAGGGALDRATLDLALARAPDLVAADGGANLLRDWGLTPRAVIGDMDSARDLDHWRGAGAQVLPIAEQDSTDLEKCLEVTEASFWLGVGFLGRRFDHTLAALHALMRFPEKRIALIGDEDAIFLAPCDWRARLAPGARVSFYPLAPTVALSSEGLEWPLERLALAAGSRIGTSNRANAAEVAARFDARHVAAMVERRYLDAVLDSLA
ncbi:MAG: thiamine diphosphokinase [Rubrimonas sp.]|uniref:thiamine diphosphokinase n=1 Tax=Rubrimonas sp. TaxID=2036015 RepID=UPI002FDEC5FB